MSWRPFETYDADEIKAIIAHNRGRPRFIVDEKLGVAVTKMLRDSGWIPGPMQLSNIGAIGKVQASWSSARPR